MKKANLAALGAIWLLAATIDASAAEPTKKMPEPVAVDLERLATELDLFAAQEDRTRVATALTGLGIGAAVVPSGFILLRRSDGVSQALVIGMLVGGSAQLLSVPLVFIPSRMDGIRKELRERIARDTVSADTIGVIELEWRQAAEAGRRKRKIAGTSMAVVGTLSLGFGLTFLLASEGVFGMSRKTQYTVGGVMMGTGISVTTIGARFLFEWSPEETAWETYRTMKDASPVPKASLVPSVALVPLPSGLAAFASMAF